jgi:membrane protease YdiL (CAAX protease family)
MHERRAQQPPDFPFYNDQPTALTAGGCVVILAACAAGFMALTWLPGAVPGAAGAWLAAGAFVALQLLGLALAVGPAWTAVFRRPRLRDVLVALAAVPLVMAVPAAVAYFVVGSANLVGNPVIGTAAQLSADDELGTFAMAALQLAGEELVTILPLLAILALLHRAGMSRAPAIAIAVLVTALAFGALHLPTYQWHLGQALLVIGSARLVLTAVYLLTRNFWASTIAHVANDWTILALATLAAGQDTP